MSDFNSVDDQSWRDEPAEERDIALHCEDYPCCGHEAWILLLGREGLVMPDGITIVCNNVPRDTVDGWELSASERADFHYLDWERIEAGEDSASFVRYKGELLDLGEFMVWASLDNPFPEWQGYRSDTFFSGVLVRYCDHFERVIVARFYC